MTDGELTAHETGALTNHNFTCEKTVKPAALFG